MLRLRPILLCAALLAPAAVHAQEGPLAQDFSDVLEKPEFWNFSSEMEVDYKRAMSRGDGLLIQAVQLRASGDDDADEHADLALAAYERASELFPDRAQPHRSAAQVGELFQAAPNFPPPSAIDRIIAHLDAYERLAPRDPDWGSELHYLRALLHTKRNRPKNLELAVADYDKALERADHTDPTRAYGLANTASNRAEVLMMLGRLDEAIAGYEHAVDLSGQITHGYGLAVALDRDGQGFRARQVAARFARLDAPIGSRSKLQEQGTFFIPRGEVHYYLALRAEGLGSTDDAIEAYTAYLHFVPSSPHAKRVRENLAALRSKAGRAKKPRPLHTRGF